MQDMSYLNSPALKIMFASTPQVLLARDNSRPSLMYIARTWLGRQLIAAGRSLTAVPAEPLRPEPAR